MTADCISGVRLRFPGFIEGTLGAFSLFIFAAFCTVGLLLLVGISAAVVGRFSDWFSYINELCLKKSNISKLINRNREIKLNFSHKVTSYNSKLR